MQIYGNIHSTFISVGIVTESILGPTTNVTSASGFADTFSVPLSGISNEAFFWY